MKPNSWPSNLKRAVHVIQHAYKGYELEELEVLETAQNAEMFVALKPGSVRDEWLTRKIMRLRQQETSGK